VQFISIVSVVLASSLRFTRPEDQPLCVNIGISAIYAVFEDRA